VACDLNSRKVWRCFGVLHCSKEALIYRVLKKKRKGRKMKVENESRKEKETSEKDGSEN